MGYYPYQLARDCFINSITVVTGQKLPMKIRVFSWKLEAVVIFQEPAVGREAKLVQSQAMMMMMMSQDEPGCIWGQDL